MTEQKFDIFAPAVPGGRLTRISTHVSLDAARAAANAMFVTSKWLKRGVDARIHVRDSISERGPDGEWMVAWSEDRFVEYA
jgi:hypothetical protein